MPNFSCFPNSPLPTAGDGAQTPEPTEEESNFGNSVDRICRSTVEVPGNDTLIMTEDDNGGLLQNVVLADLHVTDLHIV